MPSRRGRGEGSIYRRQDDGRWVGSVTIEETGRKRYVTGKTRQEVQRKLGALQREIEQGIAANDGRQTVAQYLTNWLETIKPTMGDGAWLCHEAYARRHFIPRIGRVALAKLTPQMVQRLYASLLADAGLSSTTVNHVHGSLHKALDAAVRLRIIGSNATDFVDVPRMAPHEIHPLAREQARAVLEAASYEQHGERLEALFALALATGMRQGELLALHWRDVDLAGRSLSVRWNLRYRAGVFTFKEPKTRRSRRRIALAPETVDALRAHRTRQLEERLQAGEVWEGEQWNDLVFCTSIGTPLSLHGSPRSAFARILQRAGLPETVRFHDLRHTCATLALSARVNPKVVSEMLGHSTVAVTLDIYSHVMPDMQEDAAAVIGALLFG
jgi:integrase